MTTLSITQSNIFTALRSFLLQIIPSGTEVIRGQENRVAEPEGSNFIVMTPLFLGRLATNFDGYTDSTFTGSISGTTLTITAAINPTLIVGSQIFGANVLSNTVITALGTGTGGIGTYTVNNAQTVASELIAAGTQNSLQETEVTIQLSIHGPASADNAQIISTLFRDEYAVDQIATSGFDITPLYSTDPKQIPFINGEQQYEDQWIIDAVLQVNPIAQTAMQFLTKANVELISVDAVYPAH